MAMEVSRILVPFLTAAGHHHQRDVGGTEAITDRRSTMVLAIEGVESRGTDAWKF
jgi:hypothetical protein